MALAAVKRRRLQELIGIGGVSDSALAKIIESLRRDAISEPVRRQDCHTAALDAIRESDRICFLPLLTGGTWNWHYLLPQSVLKETLARSLAVADAYRYALARWPNSSDTPWRLICYFDELTPGVLLRPDNRRKTMSVYISFAELGPQLLCRCEFWMTVAVARTTVIRYIVGGRSRMLRDLLRAAFLGEETFESGVLVHLGGPRLFFARLGNIIADESALKMAFDAKGASGLRCCPGCNNVMLRGSDLAERDRSGYLVELTCADLTKFDWSSDEDIVESIDLLLRSKGVMGPGDFQRLERSAGFNHNPDGLLADGQMRSHVRPASILTFDPMHCLWSNGVVAFEVHCFVHRMQSNTKLGWRDLQSFCQADWVYPAFCSAKGRAIHEVFNEAREKASEETFRAGATELLIVLPLLLHFAELFLARSLLDEVRCLRALMAVAHECQEAKFGRADVDKLRSAIARHIDIFRLVYGEEEMKPKSHYVCHLPRQVARDGFLMDAFTCTER